MEYLQVLYQKDNIKSGGLPPFIPDFVNMELFFIFLTQLERNLNKIAEIDRELDQKTAEKKRRMLDIT